MMAGIIDTGSAGKTKSSIGFLNRLAILCVLVLILGSTCVSMPMDRRKQFTWKHYKYSVLLAPEKLSYSPQLDIALSLMRMEYPADQADFLHTVLYDGFSPDEYRDRVIFNERAHYRTMAAAEQPLIKDVSANNWWRSETIALNQYLQRGMIVERNLIYYYGDDYAHRSKLYYVLDMEEYRQLKIEDFILSYQENERVRSVVYEELRKYSNLERTQYLSEGIYFINEPELSFNFFLTEEGLGLHWDPDQIAPYFHGEIEIVLPWYAIRPMMSQPSVDVLLKFITGTDDMLKR